jgi:hypothetical protein
MRGNMMMERIWNKKGIGGRKREGRQGEGMEETEGKGRRQR